MGVPVLSHKAGSHLGLIDNAVLNRASARVFLELARHQPWIKVDLEEPRIQEGS